MLQAVRVFNPVFASLFAGFLAISVPVQILTFTRTKRQHLFRQLAKYFLPAHQTYPSVAFHRGYPCIGFYGLLWACRGFVGFCGLYGLL